MINLEDYGFMPKNYAAEEQGVYARVTAVHKERYEIICEKGKRFARLKGTEYYGGNEVFPAVGDFVVIDFFDEGESRIRKTLTRKSFFSRLDPSSSGHGEQAVAANFDYVFILQSLNHDFNVRRLERYLTLAWQSGAIPAVVLTKADLPADFSEQLRAAEKCASGVGVFPVSAKTGFGLEALSEYLKPGKTTVFLGSSGVGKSSLLNALADEELMTVNDIREEDSRGRHTTTYRQLIMLKNGAMLIDTPGMRELGMWDVSEGLDQSFSDVEEHLGRCRFSDCRHVTEPGCAIKAAIESGELSEERWNSYNKLKSEAKYTDDKGAYLRQKNEWHKSISKFAKTLNKKGDFI